MLVSVEDHVQVIPETVTCALDIIWRNYNQARVVNPKIKMIQILRAMGKIADEKYGLRDCKLFVENRYHV